jgi:hypothetical protein
MDAILAACVFVGITVFLSLGPALTFLLTPRPPEPKKPPSKGKLAHKTVPVKT